MVGRKLDKNGIRKNADISIKAKQQLEPNLHGKTNCLTTVSKDNLVYKFRQDTPTSIDSKKHPTLRANAGGKTKGIGLDLGYNLRRLTVLECSRLQTIPENYKFILFDIDYKISYICKSNQCLNSKLCKNVKLKDAKTRLQLKKLRSVVSTTNNSKEKVLWSIKGEKLINPKNVKSKIAIEDKKQLKAIVSCIINDSSDLELLFFQKEILNVTRNVNIVIKKLDGQDHQECVQSISKCGDFMTMRYTLKKEDLNQVVADIFEIQMEFQCIGKSWNNTWEENLKKVKLSTILIWINPIIESIIYTYAKTSPNMQLSILNLESTLKMVSKFQICYLKTEGIYTSNSSAYKLLGNGWTVEVIKHILSFLE